MGRSAQMNEFSVVDLRKIVDVCLGGGDGVEPLTEANLDAELADLGYDSLTLYEVVTKLQDDLHISITDDEIDAMKTARAVVELVNGRLADAA
jgi:acyl carrier protein